MQLTRLLSLAALLAGALAATRLAAQPPSPEGLPEVPKGVEVQTRGPIHEAFATPTAEAAPTALVPKKPPAPIEEMPPNEKPEGNVQWIGGYWGWDDERQDYLWVSGCWRAYPAGRTWIGGYWREQGEQWQWVAGFWAQADKQEARATEIVYQPAPPPLPQVAPPGAAPNPNSFYVPGHWVWRDGRYLWSSGYWAQVQPNYVWVPAHYRWTPSGYVFIAGYWDYTLAERGMLYAPVVVDRTVVGATFVYTPAYAVSHTVVVDAMFVRPAHCHYYFGDYYGPECRRYGYESCVVYSRNHYDSIVVYRTWEHREEPHWHDRQVTIYVDRDAGRQPRPPRTLVQQQTIIRQQTTNINITNVQVVAPANKIAADRGAKTVVVNNDARLAAQAHAQDLKAVAVQQRPQTEAKAVGVPSAPRTAAIQVPPALKTVAPSNSAGAAPQVGAAGTKSGVLPGNQHQQLVCPVVPALPPKTGTPTGPVVPPKTGTPTSPVVPPKTGTPTGPVVPPKTGTPTGPGAPPKTGTPGSGTVPPGSHGPVVTPPPQPPRPGQPPAKDDKKQHPPGK